MSSLAKSVGSISRFGAAALATTGGVSALANLAATGPAGAAGAPPNATSTLPAASTLQSCVPYFGLQKTTSNLVRFQIQTSGAVSVTPSIGTSVIPILTATDSGGVSVHCVLDQSSLAWTSESDFFGDSGTGYLHGGNATFGPYTWPGTNDYYETPAIGQSFTVDGASFTPASVTIGYETTIPDASITPSISTPEDTQHGFGVEQSQPPIGDPGVVMSSDRMVAAGGTQGAADMLAQLQTTGACSADPSSIDSYNVKISLLNSGEQSPATYDCGANTSDAAFQSEIVYDSSLFQVKVNDANLVVTISQQVPTPTVPTTAAPASLAATGSPLGFLGGIVALSTAAGLMAIRRNRRATRRP